MDIHVTNSMSTTTPNPKRRCKPPIAAWQTTPPTSPRRFTQRLARQGLAWRVRLLFGATFPTAEEAEQQCQTYDIARSRPSRPVQIYLMSARLLAAGVRITSG